MSIADTSYEICVLWWMNEIMKNGIVLDDDDYFSCGTFAFGQNKLGTFCEPHTQIF